MTIKELRMDMMKSKKTDQDRAKVLQAILGAAQLIAKEDGNREPDDKDIVTAAKREIKMNQQSKDSGAPYIEAAFAICNEFLPKMMTESKTKVAINVIIGELEDKSPKAMGIVMNRLKSEYGDMIDTKLASGLVKNILSNQ